MSYQQPVRYWYKAKNTAYYEEITKPYITRHFEYNLNLYPVASVNTFSLEITNPKDSGGDYIYISEGDSIAITDYSKTKLFCFEGKIQNPTPDPFHWKYAGVDKAEFKYNLTCKEKDFNSFSIITSMSHVDSTITTILDDIFTYSDSSIGGVNTTKYVLVQNIGSQVIKSFVAEYLLCKEALDKFCKENFLFYYIDSQVQPNATNNLKIERTIYIFNRSGIAASKLNSSWGQGINDEILKKGKIVNPNNSFNNTRYPYYPAENNFQIAIDTNVLVNMVVLHGNFYTSNTNTTLTRYETAARVGVFTYELPDKADDILYVSTLIDCDTLSGCTTTVIKVRSVDAVNMNVGDTILCFPQSGGEEQFYAVEPTDFRTILSISTSGDISSVTLNSALPFTPVENDFFQVVGNHTIYDEYNGIDDLVGVTKVISKNSKARLRFLDQSEPHEPERLVCYYRKIESRSIIVSGSSNTLDFEEVRKKEYRLDDDNIMTTEEAEEIARSLLITEPNYTLSVKSDRSEIPRLGGLIPINLTNMFTGNLMISNVNGKYTGAIDQNKDPKLQQEVILKTYNFSSEELFKKYQDARKATETGTVINKKVLREKLTFQDFVTVETSSVESFTYRVIYASDRNPSAVYSALYVINSDGTIPLDETNDSEGRIDNDGLTAGSGANHPSWSPDYTWYVYRRIVGGTSRLVRNSYPNSTPADASYLTTGTGDNTNAIRPVISNDGNYIAYAGGNASNHYNIFKINSDGTGKTQLSSYSLAAPPYMEVAWSPDDTQLVYSYNSQIYVMNADGTNKTQLTSSNSNLYPSFSRDGLYIVFTSNRVAATNQVFRMKADGTNVTQLTSGANPHFNSKVGFENKIVYSRNVSGDIRIWTMNIDGSNQTLLIDYTGYSDDDGFGGAYRG